MKRRRQSMIRSATTFASVLLAWWLLDLAGARGSHSLAQFLCLLFCVLGIERIASAVVDLTAIAFEPRNRTPHGA